MKGIYKEDKEKGSMTVVLSLLLMMVLTLVLGLLESARMQCARAQFLANADMGMFSLLGTYDRNLLEWYDVFFLDGGMSTDTIQTESLCGLLAYYCGASSPDGNGVWRGSWTGLSMGEAEISAVMLAADDGGKPFLSQAVRYAKEHLVFSALEIKTENNANEYFQQGKDALTQADSISGQMEEIRSTAMEQQEETYDYSNLEFENPIHIMQELLRTGITALTGKTVSETGVQEKELMSRRSRTGGWGIIEKQPKTETADGLLFNAYILDKFPCFADDEILPANVMRYQTEYVLSGKGTDKENLEAVLNQLLLIRFGLNLGALTASGECMGKAGAMAAAVAVSSGLPILEPVMKTAILLLWALEEGLTDIRTLCAGGKVELAKTAEDFVCPIEALFSFQIQSNTGSEKGMDYEGYLQWMLASVPIKTRVYRCMDMAEHTIRIRGDRPGFRMDTQIFVLKAEIKGHIRTMFLPSRWDGGEYKTIVTGSYITGN